VQNSACEVRGLSVIGSSKSGKEEFCEEKYGGIVKGNCT